MASRNTSGTNTVLIIFMLLITFPIWVTLGGIMLGLAGGLIGVLVGVCAAIFGVFVALIALPFKILFGLGDWGYHDSFFHFGDHTLFIIAMIILVALILRRQRSAS